MTPRALHRPSILLRVLLYLAVILALWRALPRGSESPGDELRLTVAGADLAPELVRTLAERYAADYPGLEITREGGGTRHALERMVNGRADVGFTCRRPSGEEQELFREALGDTLLSFPVAVGALLLLRAEALPAIGPDELRAFLRGEMAPVVAAFDRLYAADPNLGTWQVLCDMLEVPATESPGARVVFVADDPAVSRAVSAEARSVGIVSSFAGGAPSGWTAAEIGQEQLFACCLSGARHHAAMFVTHVTSPRGQRQIEDAGFRPAQPILREVYLTRRPVGQ
ncbi:MAG: substrate-binding domain-containing protein [Candidatus Eiseniibacteriota bacterium]